MKLHNSDVLSQGMREYGDGTQTVRQTTRGKLITFDPKIQSAILSMSNILSELKCTREA